MAFHCSGVAANACRSSELFGMALKLKASDDAGLVILCTLSVRSAFARSQERTQDLQEHHAGPSCKICKPSLLQSSILLWLDSSHILPCHG